ncbi:MAG TPA: hypothetical protein VJB57_00720 [Dehalococcoidia bacterium]|nr:hypothetical protein [Dehalococcoidia bacterium]
MYDLALLEATFGVEEDASVKAPKPALAPRVKTGDEFDKRLRSLLRANGGKYERCLAGQHEYPSDSEASMAVVDAMVVRHFSDTEIWQTLESSALYSQRVEKKGERHARELYQAEIAKARAQVTPFEQDPGARSDGKRDQIDSSGASVLPEIVVTGERLHALSEAAWDALQRVNNPPRLFQHAGAIAEIRRDEDGRHMIRDLPAAAIKGRLDRSANWMRETRTGLVPARPPKDVIEDMMALEKPLPIVRGIVGTPVFRPDGNIAIEPGYQSVTGLFYVPVGIPVPAVPASPDANDLMQARTLLFEEWLCDFPFVDQASRANTVGATLTPLAREMIQGPTPLTALDAPSPGTGKGLLAETIGVVVSGAAPAVMNDARQEDEIRKRITSLLREGHPIVLIDNVKRRLTSPTLAALLTSTFWADRLLGGNELARLPNRSLWLVTGNNLDFDNEIARRTAWIRLDSQADRPWERQGFRQNPLVPWVTARRHELVWALLVILQNWIAGGRPRWSGQPMGTFESWCDVIGGALQTAGIEGFLGNRSDLYRQAGSETEDWRAFVVAWWETFEARPVKASELLAMVQRDQLLLSLFATARDNATERSLVTRLGAALATRRDRRYGRYFIRVVGRDGHAKGTVYRLEPATQDGPGAEPLIVSGQGSAEVPQPKSPISDSNAEPAERAEPEIHVDAQRDQAPLLQVEAAHEHDSPSVVIEVPQVPHVPQTDSKPPQKAAEPSCAAEAEVPHEVPQDVALRGEWTEEVGG